MIFAEPLPFREALDELHARDLFPTELSSAEIRELDEEIRLRSLLSARTTKARPLQELRNQLEQLLDGRSNLAKARAEMQAVYDELAYDPERGGFPGDASIPPAERGSLRDLSSDMRVDLVLTTNMRQIANRAYQRAGQTDAALFAFPCWELLRIYPRQVPRGKRREKGAIVDDPGNDWPSRWESVGGQFYGDGRMIAAKDDQIWQELGSSANFRDALDTDVPPFAFGSGYGIAQVPREECVALGVIAEGRVIEGIPRERAAARASLAKFDTAELEAILQDLDGEIATSGEVTVTGGKAARGLASNSGTSEGARKGWETRRRRSARAGAAALERAMATQSDVLHAMHRADLGDIDFRWKVGRNGGIGHMIEARARQHTERPDLFPHSARTIARRMIITLAKGRRSMNGTRKAHVEYLGHRVVLGRDVHGIAGAPWVVTAFKILA